MRTASFFNYFGPGKISIATRPPKAMADLPQVRRLAPRYDMLKLPWSEYVPAFNSILAKLDPRATWDFLHERAGQGVEPVICCYEHTDDCCHRRLVAEWFQRELGEAVTEFPGPQKELPLLGTLRDWAVAVVAAKKKP
jgi:hypothetical protein